MYRNSKLKPGQHNLSTGGLTTDMCLYVQYKLAHTALTKSNKHTCQKSAMIIYLPAIIKPYQKLHVSDTFEMRSR